MEILKKPKTVADKVEDLRKALWLFYLIIWIISFFVELPEYMDSWNQNYIQPAIAIIEGQKNIVKTYSAFTIKERTFLRESPDAKSKRLYLFVYDTKLRVFENVARWIEVEYIDESGNSFIGWVAKVNVEIEEDAAHD